MSAAIPNQTATRPGAANLPHPAPLQQIPSTEKPGCIALVVARGDRLFAVGAVQEAGR